MEFVRFDETIRQKIVSIACPSEETKLVSEIASRVLELQETNPTKCSQFLDRLTKLQQQTETGFILVLQILSGSRAELESYSKQSIKAGKSKQYIHAQRRRDIAKIQKIFPEIAKVIQDSIWKKRKI